MFSPSSLPYTGQQIFDLGFSSGALGSLFQVTALHLGPAPVSHSNTTPSLGLVSYVYLLLCWTKKN